MVMKGIKDNWFLFIVALFLFGALGTWPYAYYQILRWVVCGTAADAAYTAFTQELMGWTTLFAIVAILFNPISPFYMQRDTWQIIDFLTTIPFLVFPFTKNKHV